MLLLINEATESGLLAVVKFMQCAGVITVAKDYFNSYLKDETKHSSGVDRQRVLRSLHLQGKYKQVHILQSTCYYSEWS